MFDWFGLKDEEKKRIPKKKEKELENERKIY